LLQVVSRPSVFSHRRIDTGARALIDTMEVGPGQRVLDLGCGSGVAALAAAVRAPGVEVLAVDANPRAVECTERGAALNGLTNVRVRLDAEAQCDAPGTFDLVLANPPYFSRHRIAEVFLDGAGRALKPGGTVLIVTKGADWFTETMRRRFRAVSVATARGYSLVSGRQP
jgi:16S rRNA (guanine1207-N2)-methyltransferase